MTTERTVELSRFWCPTCRVPVATATVREIHTGPPGETIHNHRNHIQIAGQWRQVDHTVITRSGVMVR